MPGEMGFPPGMLFGDWSSIGLGTLAHVSIALLVTLHSLREPREPRSTLLWIYLAWALPVLGAMIYLAFGVNRIPVKGWQKQRSDQHFLEERLTRERESHPLAYWRGLQRALAARPSNPADAELNQVLDRLHPGHPLLGGNDIQLLEPAGLALEAMFLALREARHHIHLSTYIFNDDAVGQRLMNLLVEEPSLEEIFMHYYQKEDQP